MRCAKPQAERGRECSLLFAELAFREFQHLFGVAGDGDFIEYLRDVAFLVDQKSHPVGEFTAKDAVDLGEFRFVVGQEREVEFFLVVEFLLLRERIDADADDDDVELSKLLSAVAKTAGLGRSATGQGFGIKP